ncbi:Mob1/phocein [Corynespora cassiicola Philippines]|uniref:Mob1/phocein n=1 Tax=Corynespora cassiicola Philippines TaxID=1448308 RepID=A0A2T2NVB2_CORCC|nr:Mob1/phocein [Corynespora cassiicola Philippines]
MTASALSPASSPRLPSPPPIAEDQLGPKSPIAASSEQQKLFSNLDHGAARRIRPGTKAEDMAEGPPLVELSEIDSAFQLTEHLKAYHNFLTHPQGSNSTVAVDRDMAHKLAQPPENIDKTLWLYELCRFLTQKVNLIIIALFSDTPACSATTCPEMRASEWQYLCAVHDPPKSCCAIDYCCHTLDWAANLLTSQKSFPSRLAMGTDQATQHQQIRHLTNIFRRVYRIFAHAWFQHREMFWKVEGRTGLYILFKTVCDVYGLIPEDNYTIPSEAEGVEPSAEPLAAPPKIMSRDEPLSGSDISGTGSVIENTADGALSTGTTTTKRHRHSPSVGAMSVTTVVEESEEEEDKSGKDQAANLAPTTEGVSEEVEAASDESTAPVETTTGEEAASEESAPTADEEDSSHAAGEAEKQKDDDVKAEADPEPHPQEKESHAPEDDKPTAETEDEDKAAATGTEPGAKPDTDNDKPGPEEPEKAEKPEASVEPDKVVEAKESEDKAGAADS